MSEDIELQEVRKEYCKVCKEIHDDHHRYDCKNQCSLGEQKTEDVLPYVHTYFIDWKNTPIIRCGNCNTHFVGEKKVKLIKSKMRCPICGAFIDEIKDWKLGI